MSVGSRIKKRRKMLGMSAEDIAQIIGVSAATVYRYESGDIENMRTDEDYSVSVALGHDVDCDFALRCKGDSMIGARIYDGDIVFIKKQDFVDDGTIAAVLIDDDATLKRVYKLSDGRIELRAANERYRPIFVGGPDDTRTFRVLGKAVAFQSLL